jgi:hypothetical protein
MILQVNENDFDIDVLNYCNDILSGKILSGIYTRKAVERFTREYMEKQRQEDFKYCFIPSLANEIIAFAESLYILDIEKKLNLLPWHKFIYYNLWGWAEKEDNTKRRFRSGYISVARKNCLDPETEILMCDGSLKKIKDIKVDDYVMGLDSKPKKVLSTHTGKDKLYDIYNMSKFEFRCSSTHLLSLKSKCCNKKKKQRILNVPVSDFIRLTDSQKQDYKGFSQAVEFEHKDVQIDPYLLGSWLGDGHSAVGRITCHKDDMWVFNNYERNSVFYDKRNKNTVTLSIKNLTHNLRLMGVINNKHIPDNYLHNDNKIRLELLAGLIDTDGHRVKKP